jgi:Na+/melibiose symporter-like transporter
MYIARYNLGNEALMGLLSMLTSIPSLLISFALPFLVKRFDKFVMFIISIVSTIVISVIMYFVGYRNLTGLLVMTVLRSIAASGMIFLNMFTADMVEYGRYKTGLAVTGISFSIQTFAAKLQTAFATALTAASLSFIGFVEGEGAVQPDGFADRLWLVSCIFPVIFAVIALPVFSRYKLRDKYVAIMAGFNSGEISREEADAGLARKI